MKDGYLLMHPQPLYDFGNLYDVVEKRAIVNATIDAGLFGYWDLENNRGDQTKFGNLLIKYVGRFLSDITLIDLEPSQRASRKKSSKPRTNNTFLQEKNIKMY